MSVLNPNVFFELGIRTALNKPVCLVRDDVTRSVPFDATVTNHHVYKSKLDPWSLTAEIESLTSHIEASMATSNSANALWSYFSMSLRARPSMEGAGVEAKVDFLNLQVEGMRQRLESLKALMSPTDQEPREVVGRLASEFVRELGPYVDGIGGRGQVTDSEIKFSVSNSVPAPVINRMRERAQAVGVKLTVSWPQ